MSDMQGTNSMNDTQSENSPASSEKSTVILPGGSSATAGRLRTILERIERLEEEKKALAEDVKDILAEAKADGFDVKIIRKIIRIRAQDTGQRAEEEAMLEVYLSALGIA